MTECQLSLLIFYDLTECQLSLLIFYDLTDLTDYEMKEKETNTVEIQDLDPDVMLEMLKFIYIGSCSINTKNLDPDAEDVIGLWKRQTSTRLMF